MDNFKIVVDAKTAEEFDVNSTMATAGVGARWVSVCAIVEFAENAENTLRSVLSQNYPYLSVSVVATDYCKPLAQKLADKAGVKIKLYSTKAEALADADSEYVCFAGASVVYLPNAVYALAVALNNANAQMVIGGMARHGVRGDKVFAPTKAEFVATKDEDKINTLAENGLFAFASGKLIARNLVQKCYAEKQTEADNMLSMLASAKSVVCTKYVVGTEYEKQYRMNTEVEAVANKLQKSAKGKVAESLLKCACVGLLAFLSAEATTLSTGETFAEQTDLNNEIISAINSGNAEALLAEIGAVTGLEEQIIESTEKNGGALIARKPRLSGLVGAIGGQIPSP